METTFENQANQLYEKAEIIIANYSKAKSLNTNSKFNIPQEYQEDFFSLIDKVNLSLMEDQDNFYGYFLMQMSREIRFDISSPTTVNFKGAKYVIYFNPIIFLNLNLKQMETTIKHEILHIVAMHLLRAKDLKGSYSTLAINMAMDIVVNTYLDYLPPYAVTFEWVNLNYSLELLPFQAFEYYVEKIQIALDLLEADQDAADENDTAESVDDTIRTDYDPERTHDLWEESAETDEKTFQDFTEKYIENSQKGKIPKYLDTLLASLRNSRNEMPWNLYLKKLMGSVEGNKKKTVTRRSRRQPDRLDLRGELRSHKAKIAVALDISGSISDDEFNQAIKEVLYIVRNYNQEITILECDTEIRRVYKIKSETDIKDRIAIRGGTKFTPVFEYANKNKFNLLIYFTDGKGEDKLQTKPKGYKTLWVITGRGEKLSLQEPYGAVKKLKNVVILDEALTLTMNDVKTEGFSMNDMQSMHI